MNMNSTTEHAGSPGLGATQTPQQRASSKQNEKRKGLRRLPSSYLTEHEHALLSALGDLYGSKRNAIMQGLELYEQELGRVHSPLLESTLQEMSVERKKPADRKDMHRMPTVYLSDDEFELIAKLGDVSGTKQRAIIRGLHLLNKRHLARAN